MEQGFETPQLARSAWVLGIHLAIRQLCEQLSSGFYRHYLTNPHSIPRRDQGSNIILFQSKPRHRKGMITSALRKLDSGDNSAFFTPDSRHSTRCVRHCSWERGSVFLSWASASLLLVGCLLRAAWPLRRRHAWFSSPVSERGFQRDAVTRVLCLDTGPIARPLCPG